ncbi:MAG: hypothetical protein PVI99_02385 [Anaerolineales bacterium]
MTNNQERRYILDMLETGTIDPQQATTLLDALEASPTRRRRSPDKVVFEIDANQENLSDVLDKLSRALHRRA